MRSILIFFAALLAASFASAQFRDDFSGDSLTLDSLGVNGWRFYTGDGSAVMRFFQPGKGYASITIDATKDTIGIWWALIKGTWICAFSRIQNMRSALKHAFG